MKFSKMDRLVTVRRITSTAHDDYGQPVETTSDSQVWAQVVYAGSPGESMKAYQIFPQRDVTFFVRHPDPTDAGGSRAITQNEVILFESREYEILGFEEIGRRDGLRIFCKEKGSDGR